MNHQNLERDKEKIPLPQVVKFGLWLQVRAELTDNSGKIINIFCSILEIGA